MLTIRLNKIVLYLTDFNIELYIVVFIKKLYLKSIKIVVFIM
ncbi:hypothetical protein CMTB2_08805 [Caminibacter mediatlanticus TB-2]|uniref:Uncharacterized protein n=1 Tax=Caminibacter mediatlanticus TB-2 TaxID=391592 RepID=A0AAI9AFS4_9BACT|nr:hypothetical protein CMTB2_08805 [Caminibacter mediatlanticus TB-2]